MALHDGRCLPPAHLRGASVLQGRGHVITTGSTNGEAMDEHPSGEEVAAYLSGRLSPQDRNDFDSHLADCRPCRQEVTSARELIRSRTPRRRLASVGIVAVAATIAVVLLSPDWFTRGNDDITRARNDQGTAPVAEEIRVVAPRNGAVIARSPAFVWHALPGRTLFRISLTTADGAEIWSGETSDTSIVVPPEVTLEKSRTYLWLIDALDADGQSLTSGTHEFRLAR